MNAIQRAAVDLIARRQPADMDAWALARVRAMGRVVLDRTPPAPVTGSIWTPERTRAFPRLVVAVMLNDAAPPLVFYRGPWLPHGAFTDHCTLATWHRWVRRTRAVQS